MMRRPFMFVFAYVLMLLTSAFVAGVEITLEIACMLFLAGFILACIFLLIPYACTHSSENDRLLSDKHNVQYVV